MPDQTNPPIPLPTPPSDEPSSLPALTEQDFYYEGQYVVFTAAYHLKRGYCCNSGCRHCPYQDTGDS
jgi:Family of unknown function (DUF5522)